jgi:hypothetical protein
VNVNLLFKEQFKEQHQTHIHATRAAHLGHDHDRPVAGVGGGVVNSRDLETAASALTWGCSSRTLV